MSQANQCLLPRQGLSGCLSLAPIKGNVGSRHKRWRIKWAVSTLTTAQMPFFLNVPHCTSLHSSTKIPKLGRVLPDVDLHRASCQTFSEHENRDLSVA